jgi:hypothetical protein
MKTLRVRAGVLATVTGLVLLGAGITTATGTASAVPGTGQDKVFVCKYVGQPNVDERLQTGQNPIDVSVSAINGPVTVGSWFKDAQGRSYVLAFDTGQADPSVSQCPAGNVPTQPNPVVTTRTEVTVSCTKYSVRTITTTTEYVLDAHGAWVLGTPVDSPGELVNSTPTADQIKTANLVCSVQPNAVVTTTTEDATTCTQYSVRTITTTTKYVLEHGAWVLGAPVVTFGKWVNSTPTAEQIKDANLVCSVPVTTPTTAVSVLGTSATAVPTKSPVGTSTTAVPTESPVSVLGTSATANPLPAAAPAGLADTSGQVIAGSLAAFAALLLLGSAFLLRRRHGVV